MAKNYTFLEFIEYVSILASGMGVIAAILGQPVVYGLVPVAISLFLNAINRKKLDQKHQNMIKSTLDKVYQHQDSIDQLSQQLKIAIISLDVVNSQLEESGIQISTGNGSSPNSVTSSLKQLSNRIVLVEQSITLLQSELEAMTRQFKHRPELEQVESLTSIIIDLQQFINELPQWGSLQQQQLRHLQQRVDQALVELSDTLAEIPNQIEIALQSQTDPGLTPKADKTAEILKKYPRSATKWTTAEDEELKTEYNRGLSIQELAKQFQRQPSAIRTRLQKLGFSPTN